MWCSIVAYIIAAATYSHTREAAITVKQLRISIVDTASTKVVDERTARLWLAAAVSDPIGRPAREIDTRAISRAISRHPEVRRATAWTDLEGTLNLRIEQRVPLMRVRSTSGHRFWYTTDDHILPDRGDISAYVPVVTGDVPFPFSLSTSGSYTALQQNLRRDFLARFIAIDSTRRAAATQLHQSRAELRAIKKGGPKRWWTLFKKLYKDEIEAFELQKEVRTAAKENEIKNLENRIALLDEQKRLTGEKEKFSYQSYYFLTKLANFVRFIERDDFLAASIVQINVVDGGGGGSHSESLHGGWHEPRVELIPRAGNHTVLFGELTGDTRDERSRLDKLRFFYLDGLWHAGWGEYRYIDIRYKDQVVCTK
jgi:cell division protein FtsQ